MCFKSLYYNLLVFHLSLSVMALDWSNNELQESNRTPVYDYLPPRHYIIGAPVLHPKPEPIKRVGKIDLAQTLKSGCTIDIDLSNLSLEEVFPEVFYLCPRVLNIDLSQNLLSTLPEYVFDLNRDLKVLNLSVNLFQELNPLWFTASSESLEELDVSQNRLTTFPVKIFPEMNQLKHLSLAENHLKDINEEDIAEKFNALNRFEFTCNYISCNRTEKLQAFFKSKNVAIAYSKLYKVPLLSDSVETKHQKETEHPQNEKECINEEELLSQKSFKDVFIPLEEVQEKNEMQDEVQVNSEKKVEVQVSNGETINSMPVILSVIFVIILVFQSSSFGISPVKEPTICLFLFIVERKFKGSLN